MGGGGGGRGEKNRSGRVLTRDSAGSSRGAAEASAKASLFLAPGASSWSVIASKEGRRGTGNTSAVRNTKKRG